MKLFIDNFIKYMELQGKRPTTANNYRLYLSRFAEYFHEPLEKITYQAVVDYQSWLNRKGFSGATTSYHITALKSFVKYLHKMGVDTIASDCIDIPKFMRQSIEVLSPEELEKILKAADPRDKYKLRDRAILEVLSCSGLRVAELTNLKVTDISLSSKEIRVRNGKGNKDRVTFLSNNAAYYLGKYLSVRVNDSEYAFNSSHAGNISPRSIQRMVIKYAREVGITRKISPHAFRHFTATNLLNRGMGLRSVQEILGHSSVATTQIYTHVTNSKLKEQYNEASMRKRKRDDISKRMESLEQKLDKIMECLSSLKIAS